MSSKIWNKYSILEEINSNSNIKTYLVNVNYKPIIKEIILNNKNDYFIIYDKLEELKNEIYEVIEEDNKIYVVIDNNEELKSKIDKLLLSEEINLVKEAKILGNLVKKNELLELLQLDKSLCKINFEKINDKGLVERGTGTGFFFKFKENFQIKYDQIKYGLFTNNHILNQSDIKLGKTIKIEYFEKFFFSYKLKQKDIIITKNRKVYTNKDLDYTCIELFESDDINDYFEIAPNINEFKNIKAIDIFILQFPEDDISFSYGKIFRIKDNKFIHNASTVKGSSGSPIIIKCENKFYVIGLHIGGIKDKKNKDLLYNLGSPLNLILKNINNHHNKILFLGLDAAGKTKILYKLKLGITIKTIPTYFNVETIKYNEINLTIWDLGACGKLRNLWKEFYPDTDGVIFVIDGLDDFRFEEAIEELEKLLDDKELKDCCFLILINKIDLNIPIDNIKKINKLLLKIKLLKLNFGYRKWKIQRTSASSGYGLKKGFDWITSVLETK